jgi:hypothetical protein
MSRMQPYEDFAVGKYAENDDTVGFYCRPDQGEPTKFGMHSYGYAIDVNPMQNPYLDAKGRLVAGRLRGEQRPRSGCARSDHDKVKGVRDFYAAWMGLGRAVPRESGPHAFREGYHRRTRRSDPGRLFRDGPELSEKVGPAATVLTPRNRPIPRSHAVRHPHAMRPG